MSEREIFEQAIQIAGEAARGEFLDRACQGDSALRKRIEDLLTSHTEASGFLQVPAVEQLNPNDSRDQPTLQLPPGGSGRDDESADELPVAADMSFLKASTKPGSIGVLGHYEILQILGQGAFGIVFKAFDEKLHRHVAIKVMNPQLAATSPPRKRFLREARAAAAIRHDNVTQVYSVEEEPIPYLVMEYIDGVTLSNKLDAVGPLEVPELLHLGKQIALGLSAAHEKSLVHRDIKPGNILIEKGAEQKVKITDFGLARAADDASLTQSGLIAGTPLYMAPEQALGQALDGRTDLFSFGSVLYQMACGRPPFRAPSTVAVLRRVVDDPQRPLREVIPEVPAWFEAIVNKLLAKKADERYQSAKEVADLLARCQSELQLTGVVTCVPGASSAGQGAGSVSARNEQASNSASGGRQPPVSESSKSTPPSPAGRGAGGEGVPKANSSGRKAIIAVAALAALVLAGLYFPVLRLQMAGKAQFRNLTRDGNTRIEFLQGDKVVAERVGFGEIELPAGEYDVRITNPDPALGVHNAILGHRRVLGLTNNVTLSTAPEKLSFVAGDRVEFMVAFTREDAAGTPNMTAGATWVNPAKGLHFDGIDDYVEFPTLTECGPEMTVEAELTPYERSNGDFSHQGVVSWPERVSMRLVHEANLVGIESAASLAIIYGNQKIVTSPMVHQPSIMKHRVRLALSWNTSSGRFLALGGAVEQLSGYGGVDPRPGQQPSRMFLGCEIEGRPDKTVTNSHFCGTIHRVRVSRGTREDLDGPLVKDGQTIALYDFAQGIGDVLKDVSGNGHDGKIVGATWVDRSRIHQNSADSNRDDRSLTTSATGVAPIGWQGWPAEAPKPAIAPFTAEQAKQYQKEWADYLKVPVEYTNSIGMKFRLIPPGEFTMGSTTEEIEEALTYIDPNDKHWQECIKSEGPRHKVILTQPIYLGLNEVTQAEYEKVMRVNPSHFAPKGSGKDAVGGLETANHPVESVSWSDAAEFSVELSQQENLNPYYFRAGETITPLNGTGYRLPREAEWEFACRAGTSTKYWNGDKNEDLNQTAWFDGNSGRRTHTVGKLKANPFGLYDIQGNVWEWVHDGWDAVYLRSNGKPVIDPVAPSSTGPLRVIRGGYWGRTASDCRSSSRLAFHLTNRLSDIGFRLSLTVDAVRQAVKSAPARTEANSGRQGWPADSPKPAVAPFDAEQAKQHQEAWAKYLKVPVEYTNSIGMKFRLIPPGEFMMGSTPDDISAGIAAPGNNAAYAPLAQKEGPQKRVTISQPFYLGVHEVTQRQLTTLYPDHVSHFSARGAGKDKIPATDADLLPADSVDLARAEEFCTALGKQEARSEQSLTYYIPTEAEWEYAARGGTQLRFLASDLPDELKKAAWCVDNSDAKPHLVGALPANPFGLYDMLGNVWEWSADGWQSAAAPAERANIWNQASQLFDVNLRVVRGAGWSESPIDSRVGRRFGIDAPSTNLNIGFRVALSVQAVRESLNVAKSAPKSAIAPFTAEQAKQHQTAWANHLDIPAEFTDKHGMKFRLIPPGEFQMGFSNAELDTLTRELKQAGAGEFDLFAAGTSGPQHTVRLTQPIYISAHEVTVAQYRAFLDESKYLPTADQLGGKMKWTDFVPKENPDTYPVVGVSWTDADSFCVLRSQKDGVTYRLPTEAEWEFACRGGSTTLWSFGDNPGQLGEHAVTASTGVMQLQPVGTRKPNAFGLLDMYCNAEEWCRDWHVQDYYAKSPVDDPVNLATPADKNSGRVARGGSVGSAVWMTRSSTRRWDYPSTPVSPKGFRVVISGDLKKSVQAIGIPDDREVAEWLFTLPASVAMNLGEHPTQVTRREDLPAGTVKIFAVQIQNMVGDAFRDADLIRLGQLGNLESLILSTENSQPLPRLTDAGIAQFAQAPAAKNFKVFHCYTSLPSLTDATLPLWNQFPSLQTIQQQGTQITDPGLRLLKSPTLGELRIFDSPQITPAGFEGAVDRLPNLTALRLKGVSLGVADLAPIVRLPIQVLQLNECGLEDHSIAPLVQLGSLRNLSLGSHPNIKDEAVRTLSSIKTLEILTLDRTGITDAACEMLASYPALTAIGLNETEITDVGLAALAKLTQVKELHLRGCSKITKEGLEKLKQALPGCQVFSDMP